MTRVLPILVLLTVTPGLLISCGPKKKKKPTTSAAVSISKQVDSSTTEYKVKGAEGKGKDGATKAAVVDALIFAAKAVAGDATEKSQAGDYVRNNMDAVITMASPGRVMKTGFASDGKKARLDLMVKVNTADLKRHLVEQQVITASRDVAKGAGKPTLMVVFKGGDCERGDANAPICALPKEIKAQSERMAVEEQKLADFQKQIFESDCLKSETDEASVEASSKDKSSSSEAASSRSSSAASSASQSSSSMSGSSSDRSSSRGRMSARASRSGASVSASGSSSSSSKRSFKGKRSASARSSSRSSAASSYKRNVNIDRESQFKAYRKSVKPSKFCGDFMDKMKPFEERVEAAGQKLDALQAKLNAVRGDLEKADTTTIKINEWFVNERWELVDSQAVDKARKLQDSMLDVSGMPEDPVAALAQLAGADIFFVHGLEETRPKGGYQAVVTLKAFEVTSGKILASKVGKSNVLTSSSEREKAITQAVGRAMQEVVNQITAYWADMSREGVKCKIVLRGDFSNTRTKINVEEALDGLADALGRRCDDTCEWEPDLSTKSTISGMYTSPAKARKRLGNRLLLMLEDYGFATNQVMANQALNIIEVQ